MMKLTANEATALTAWRDTCEDFDILSFADIASLSGLPRRLVRRTVRNMARKGITHFVRGCWTEDGEPRGSGYGLTGEGRKLLADDGKCEAERALDDAVAADPTFPVTAGLL